MKLKVSSNTLVGHAMLNNSCLLSNTGPNFNNNFLKILFRLEKFLEYI